MAIHLQKIERQAARLEQQVAHPRGRPEAAGELELLAAHLGRLEAAAAALGPDAGALIHECVMAMEFGASAEDIARAFHGHPTLNEAVKEAALAVAGRAIHI